jgi:hypothetical protein
MSSGAYILTQSADGSTTFAGLRGDLDCAVTEIRIEQHLDRRATFGIRFQEDFEDGEGGTVTAADLRGAKGMAILVDGGPGQPPKDGLGVAPIGSGELICLICGQIENSEADVSVGVSGSWYEVRGQDVRTRAARDCGPYDMGADTLTGLAEALTTDFMTGEFHAAVSAAKYPKEQPYVFSGSKLEGLENLSKLCDCPIRLEYKLKPLNTFDGEGHEQFDIVVDVRFEPSPPSGPNMPSDDFKLIATDKMIYLRIMGSEGACENVINFSLQSDNEAISSVSSAAIDLDTGEAQDVEGQPASQTALTEGEGVKDTGAQDGRTCRLSISENPDIAAAAANSAANEASWYVKATALTTAHMLGTVLQPHDLVEVVGGGCGISGVFQVEKVVHVINGAGHWMHLDLRSNSRSLKPPKEGIIDG